MNLTPPLGGVEPRNLLLQVLWSSWISPLSPLTSWVARGPYPNTLHPCPPRDSCLPSLPQSMGKWVWPHQHPHWVWPCYYLQSVLILLPLPQVQLEVQCSVRFCSKLCPPRFLFYEWWSGDCSACIVRTFPWNFMAAFALNLVRAILMQPPMMWAPIPPPMMCPPPPPPPPDLDQNLKANWHENCASQKAS